MDVLDVEGVLLAKSGALIFDGGTWMRVAEGGERRGQKHQDAEEVGVSRPYGGGWTAHLAGEGILGGLLGVCAGLEVLVVHLRQLASELLLCQDKKQTRARRISGRD